MDKNRVMDKNMPVIKFENVSDDISYANGTSLRGYIQEVTTNQLIALFGEPNREESGDGKVNLEWIIKTEITDGDGNVESGVFTLYDWKGSAPYNDDAEWTINVGGKSIQDYWNVMDAFDIANKTDFLYAYEGNGKICNDDFSLVLLELCREAYDNKEVANG